MTWNLRGQTVETRVSNFIGNSAGVFSRNDLISSNSSLLNGVETTRITAYLQLTPRAGHVNECGGWEIGSPFISLSLIIYHTFLCHLSPNMSFWALVGNKYVPSFGWLMQRVRVPTRSYVWYRCSGWLMQFKRMLTCQCGLGLFVDVITGCVQNSF